MTTDEQPFTEDELRLLFLARAAQQEGHDLRPSDDLWPEAHRMAERGWLQRRFNQQNGEIVFRWTQEAEAALDLGHLMATVSPN
jgi:hypothetical protein